MADKFTTTATETVGRIVGLVSIFGTPIIVAGEDPGSELLALSPLFSSNEIVAARKRMRDKIAEWLDYATVPDQWQTVRITIKSKRYRTNVRTFGLALLSDWSAGNVEGWGLFDFEAGDIFEAPVKSSVARINEIVLQRLDDEIELMRVGGVEEIVMTLDTADFQLEAFSMCPTQ